MSSLQAVTPLIITYNEQENIARTLGQLGWAQEVVVVDSGSTDGTLKIIQNFPNTRVVHRSFDTMADQWNFALSQASSEWVLTLDADYFVTDKLRDEVAKVVSNSPREGYRIPFRYCVFGKALRSSILPPRDALFRRTLGSYYNDGHTQRVILQGSLGHLSSPILHDDRKPFSRWLRNQDGYLSLEAEKIQSAAFRDLSMPDLLRKLILPAPLAVLLLCLFGRRCLFEGWRGWYYTLQRVLAEIILSLKLIEGKLSIPPSTPPDA